MASQAHTAELEKAIRQAVLDDSFPEAQVLLDQYAEAMAAALAHATGRAELLLMQDRVGKLFDWVAAMVTTARANDAARFDRLNHLQHYTPAFHPQSLGSQA